ncbi:hypothetical protein [Corynebacterium guaraldiae]|uniref:hypothetical protein n=1 Tax=Corynebacterium guaraldiae TaxID=3051103 RepID=UPI0032AEFAC3
MPQDIYIAGAARLPIGKFGGSLAQLSLTELVRLPPKQLLSVRVLPEQTSIPP